jgi:hypothetical protein
VAGRAGADAVAGVFDVDVVLEQDVADRFAAWRVKHGAFWAQHWVGKDDDLWHLGYLG